MEDEGRRSVLPEFGWLGWHHEMHFEEENEEWCDGSNGGGTNTKSMKDRRIFPFSSRRIQRPQGPSFFHWPAHLGFASFGIRISLASKRWSRHRRLRGTKCIRSGVFDGVSTCENHNAYGEETSLLEELRLYLFCRSRKPERCIGTPKH